MKIEKNPRTDTDVQMLWTIFPDILPDGRQITHAQLEAVLSLSRLASRYRSVVNKWRRQLFRERRVFLDGRTAQGAGFVALTPDEMVRYSNREVRASGRKLMKAIAIAAAPNDEELSTDVRRYRHLLEAAAVKIANEHKATIREVSKAMAPMKQLPRAAGA